MSIRFRSTGSPIDFTKVFTLEQAASALIFNQTGKNCPTNIKRDNTEYAGFWDWYDILFESINDKENPLIAHLKDDSYNDNYVCIISIPYYLIDRQDFERWCNNKGINPGFLLEETELKSAPIIKQNTSKTSIVDLRIDKIIEILIADDHNVMSVPYGGKKATKINCLLNFSKKPLLFTESTFEQAWSQGSKQNRLCLLDKNKFTPHKR